MPICVLRAATGPVHAYSPNWRDRRGGRRFYPFCGTVRTIWELKTIELLLDFAVLENGVSVSNAITNINGSVSVIIPPMIVTHTSTGVSNVSMSESITVEYGTAVLTLGGGVQFYENKGKFLGEAISSHPFGSMNYGLAEPGSVNAKTARKLLTAR
ncbi:hypothetical protein CYMTET_26448 [Cymbomonas tetramitiformis]|uniref:Uncharacterized protein n=1 Tax=Cymbomonas tetramitiformis TaxID=36881 RepID=A0AAE0FSJ1_9CHLO|nr:hypothetical protein CYMTET_26448 [Cymbomonas tetramitiformis]